MVVVWSKLGEKTEEANVFLFVDGKEFNDSLENNDYLTRLNFGIHYRYLHNLRFVFGYSPRLVAKDKTQVLEDENGAELQIFCM